MQTRAYTYMYVHIQTNTATKTRKASVEAGYGEMQCPITLEILSAILEFVIGFVSNFYN